MINSVMEMIWEGKYHKVIERDLMAGVGVDEIGQIYIICSAKFTMAFYVYFNKSLKVSTSFRDEAIAACTEIVFT